MKNFSVWVAAVAAVSLISLTAGAQTSAATKCEPGERYQHFDDTDGGAPGPRHRHIQKDRFPAFAGLDLTDAQKKTIADARAAQEPTMRALHEKVRAAHEALDKAGDANADDATLANLSNDLAALLAQGEVARIKMHKQFVSVLTPEQKQKLEAFKAEHKDGPRWKDKKQNDAK